MNNDNDEWWWWIVKCRIIKINIMTSRDVSASYGQKENGNCTQVNVMKYALIYLEECLNDVL